ncbi:MAG: dual specificity protein phosphatase family protein [Nitrososphaerales archaeon]
MSDIAEELYFTWLIPNQLAASKGPRSKEDLKFLKDSGVDCLIRLADIDETLVSSKDVLEAGLEDYHEPVPDYCPPSQAQLDRLVHYIDTKIKEGKRVAVSCRAGVGRTGTLLACYLIYTGLNYEAALARVRENRLGSVKTSQQESAVKRYALRLGRGLVY